MVRTTDFLRGILELNFDANVFLQDLKHIYLVILSLTLLLTLNIRKYTILCRSGGEWLNGVADYLLKQPHREVFPLSWLRRHLLCETYPSLIAPQPPSDLYMCKFAANLVDSSNVVLVIVSYILHNIYLDARLPLKVSILRYIFPRPFLSYCT